MLFSSPFLLPFSSFLSNFFLTLVKNASSLSKHLTIFVFGILIISCTGQPLKHNPDLAHVSQAFGNIHQQPLLTDEPIPAQLASFNNREESIGKQSLQEDLRTLRGAAHDYQDLKDIENDISYLDQEIEPLRHNSMINENTAHSAHKDKSMDNFELMKLIYGSYPSIPWEPINYKQLRTRRLGKRSKGLQLSLTNNIDVLREKLFMEIARRKLQLRQSKVDSANNGLASIG